jgi:hypothetical protein
MDPVHLPAVQGRLHSDAQCRQVSTPLNWFLSKVTRLVLNDNAYVSHSI